MLCVEGTIRRCVVGELVVPVEVFFEGVVWKQCSYESLVCRWEEI